jgi:hypothetical protein
MTAAMAAAASTAVKATTAPMSAGRYRGHAMARWRTPEGVLTATKATMVAAPMVAPTISAVAIGPDEIAIAPTAIIAAEIAVIVGAVAVAVPDSAAAIARLDGAADGRGQEQARDHGGGPAQA